MVPWLAARPLSGHATPVWRQQAPAQAEIDRSDPRHPGQSYRGSDPGPGRHRRSSQSYRDVEELLAERGIEVDHVTVFRWVQRFTPLLIDAARPCRRVPGDRWFVRQGRRAVGLSVPGDRPVRAGHRRAGLPKAGHSGDPPILHPRTRARAVSDRGHHRQSNGLPARPRGDRPGSLAPHRALRQQPDRIRPRPIKVPAPANARPQTAPLHASDQRRARVHPEPFVAATTNSGPKKQ
jgi:hypothetical protein